MACGLPVITSRFNGAAELMTEGIEGYVLDDPSNCHELVECLRCVINSQHRPAMAQAARQLAELHPLDANFESIFELYEDVLERKERAWTRKGERRHWETTVRRAA
jgi:UDP-glucose:(heptosyl)LPS alpha-1,3-glucosyltransferase